MSSPLHGIRIVDMSSVLMGPFAAQSLAELGADVVKIEPPQGDLVRQIGPARHAGMGPVFLNANRHKRSVVLDLKQAEGLQALHLLLRDADVLMYNLRPQAMQRLGLGYEAVAELNPRIVYAGLLGFGNDGPYAGRPAYDDLIQGACTLSHLMARASGGPPRYVPTAMADRIVGLTAVSAILATLMARERSGRGDRVDIPMFETMVGFTLGDHLGGLSFEPPLDGGGYARQLSAERRPYRTRDGHLCAMVYSDKQWRSFLGAIQRESLLDDERFAGFAARTRHVDAVYAELSRIFLERDTADWLQLLEQADVPCMPLHDLHSVLHDPHLQATGFFVDEQHPSEGPLRAMRSPLRWQHLQPAATRPAPRLGEHTREVLAEAGLAPERIQRLLDSGAARQAADWPAPATAPDQEQTK
ncbi:MAG: CoA transferase [Burkholderiaceae bacterium]|nr:CoA transferase [Burkholderiaceae bacterium]